MGVPGAAAHLAGGGLAGLVAAVAMDLPMGRQPDGWAPARVAAAVLTRSAPEAVPLRRAVLLHHVTGALAGGLYGATAFLLGRALPAAVGEAAPLAGHLLAAAAVSLFVYLFFAHAVFPRAGGAVYERRATAVRGQWLRSTLTFAVAVTLAGPALIALLAGG